MSANADPAFKQAGKKPYERAAISLDNGRIWPSPTLRVPLLPCSLGQLYRGLEIFRIEKLKVVQITDQTKFGKFYSGDSYIVLNVRPIAVRTDKPL